ncbi:MAG: cyclic nucleotide-binding domain-containing protein [Candidatus Latescibacteria bacterium]|nr:cyclic nucleotide-binding domain-containing protein [Candidatus Latescibacterota bacterium]
MEEETRRSGIDRRKEQGDIESERRSGTERREMLTHYDHIIGFMKDIPLFKGLSTQQYKELLSICYQKILPKHCYIYEEGDKSRELYVITRGCLKIMYHQSTFLDKITPIGLVGEIGVFTGANRTTSVITETECTIITIRKNELFTLFKNDADLSIRILLNVINVLGLKIGRYNEIIEDMQKKSRNLLF